MPSIMDISPVARKVTTAHYGDLDVPGVTGEGLVRLLMHHPELIPLLRGESGDVNMDSIFQFGMDVVTSFLAVGLGADPSDEQARTKIKALSPDDILQVGEAIMEHSFPNGVKSFLERVKKVAEAMTENVVEMQTPETSSKTSGSV